MQELTKRPPATSFPKKNVHSSKHCYEPIIVSQFVRWNRVNSSFAWGRFVRDMNVRKNHNCSMETDDTEPGFLLNQTIAISLAKFQTSHSYSHNQRCVTPKKLSRKSFRWTAKKITSPWFVFFFFEEKNRFFPSSGPDEISWRHPEKFRQRKLQAPHRNSVFGVKISK